MVVADIVNFVRRNRQSVLSVFLFGRTHHYTFHAFHNVVNISEIAFAIPVIENLNRLAFDKFVRKAEIRHIRSARRTIYRKKSQTR